MSSTNKLYSRLRTYIAKFLLSFCGIASFGVVGMAVVIGCALFSFSFFSSSASAVGENGSNTVGANISSSIAIRLLDSTASTDITRLDFNLTPTAPGTSFNPSISQGTERTVVDVATSNPTGYKLYMQSNYQDSSSNYTTDLVHTTNGTPDVDIADTIPTSTSASTLYWNYTNPTTSNTTVIPAHGNPDKLDQYYDATNSRQTPVDINVSVDTTIVSGTYQNQLLFSAVGNPEPVSYTVSFDGDGGTPVPSTITGSATSSTFSTAIDSTIPVKTGYTFSHWEITSVSSTSPTPDINPTATCNSTSTCNPGDSLDISTYGEPGVVVALTAVYTINTHTVTITNGTGIDSTTISCSNSSNNTTNTCTYGDTVTISATPATGYSFSSWTTSDVTIENNQFTMPDSDVAITANAVKMYSYTLNLNNNDGTTNKQVLNYPTSGGTADTSHTFTNLNSLAPSRSGYKFLGWATSASGTSYVDSYTLNSSSASTTPTSSGFPVTGNLYARWEQDKTLAETCGEASPEATFTYDGIQYIKLYTNAAKTTTACYTKDSQGTATWANASSLCPSGTGVPTRANFGNLITAYGSSSGLNNATGWGTTSSYPNYWSSTEYNNNSSLAYFLYVGSSRASIDGSTKTNFLSVVCIVPPTIANSTYFQEVNSCPSTLPTGTEYTLTDQGQTSKTYKAAKLADNKCWMTTNYNHTAGALSSTYYNVSSSGYTIPNSVCTTSFNGYCDGTTKTATSSYGGYYNWTVATAGSNSTTYSICPKGWRLPTNAEFTDLISKYNASSKGSNLFTGDPKMQYGGFCYRGAYACGYVAGSLGYYWSSTVGGSSSYYLLFNSSSAGTVTNDRSAGVSVRCVFGS